MVEPTESEDLAELDRFCEAMISIRGEIAAVERGAIASAASPLKFAPHTAEEVAGETWDRAYTRNEAAWPLAWLHEQKYWPPVSRLDNTWGDRNVFCSCNAWDTVDTSVG
jgi:glycine dehydrogenase